MSSTERLIDRDGLESALECGVFLDVAAVLLERGGADHVQLAARQHRLEHVAGVHGAFGRARAYDGVHLVDEQQDPAVGGLDLGEDRLEPFLELAAVLGAREQRAQVEAEYHLVAQALRHVAAVDALRQALDDGGLADAGIADEYRVVLGLPGQDLNHAADLGVAADDRVEPAGRSVRHEVPAVLLERLVRRPPASRT